MAHDYSISDFGLKLIKAYEGFRPVETVLVSGQRVIGYGHEFVPGEVSVLTIKKATELLKADLKPFEDLVNNSIFAPLSQSQFDALVSLSFNIGEEAFLNSSVVHNLNNGQPLAAAAGFDEWRKSVIVDQTYVVDALVRRRTAEKALFLSPATGVVAAPRKEVPPLHDSAVKSGTEDIEIFGKTDANGYVEQTPYVTQPTPRRRREDGPSGILTLSERAPEPQIHEEALGENTQNENSDIDFVLEDEVEQDAASQAKASREIETEQAANLSPIALAAAEVSDRLDSLMDDNVVDNIQQYSTEDSQNLEVKLVDKRDAITHDTKQDNTVDEVSIANDTTELSLDRTAGLEQQHDKTSQDANVIRDNNTNSIGAYWTALVVGILLLGGGWWKLNFSSAGQLDEMSAFLAPVAMLVGAMMILGGFYYLLKTELRSTTT